MRAPVSAAASAVVLLFSATGCGSNHPGPSPTRGVDGVAVQQMATLNQPVALALRAGEHDRLYVAEKGGVVRRLRVDQRATTVDAEPVLDIQTRVSTGTEQGLLGIAFGPTGAKLYADYTDTTGNTRVVEYPYDHGRAASDSERLLFTVAQPYSNHNGGNLVFGPDGFLYVGMGDGGGAGDPLGHAQNPASLLGKLLRIDAGAADAKPEIWAAGLRNPWRFSFDRANGDLWIGDVGQDAWEEIDHAPGNPRGLNYGWNNREASHAFNGAVKPTGVVDPVYEYRRDAGNCAITGGFVYRGSAIRGLGGAFVFADYCKGRLMAIRSGTVRDLRSEVASPTSFGQDADGELWVLSQAGGVSRLVPA